MFSEDNSRRRRKREVRSLSVAEAEPHEARFWEKAYSNGECLLWRSGHANGTVPSFMIGRYSDNTIINLKITRVAWVLHSKEDLPATQNVEQTCGDRRCISRTHLKLVPAWTITRKAVEARLQRSTTPEADRARFMGFVHKHHNGCWYWQGAISNDYGVFQYEGGRKQAHRVSYALFVGPVADGLVMRHKCDRRICVNPAHLEPGTHAENMQDMVDRGRSASGERQSKHVYLEWQIPQIKGLHRPDDGCLKALANMYGGTSSAIWAVVNGESWKNVKPDPVLLKLEIEYPSGKTTLLPSQRIELCRLYDAGASLHELADRFQLKYHRVWSICVKSRGSQGMREKQAPRWRPKKKS